ncbi:MAG: DUF1540 domain-containing protein [Firmicutes bacterium]|nr:DUF1540 domain-containing protein [Bacillota bacterium]
MKDLKCSMGSCEFNKGYSCCAKQISIGENTACTSFSPRQNSAQGDQAAAKTEPSFFEAGSDFVAANYGTDTSVGCDAGCIFQKQNNCTANGITVMKAHGKAECLTFIKK